MSSKKETFQQVNFWEFFRIFKKSVIIHFFLISFQTPLLIATLIASDKFRSSDPILFKHFSVGKFELLLFIVFSTVIVSICGYYKSLLEHNIVTESSFYLRNLLINKFNMLKFEQKAKNTYELKAILEEEFEVFCDSWHHVPSHLYKSLLSATLIIFWKIVEFWNSDKMTIFIFSFANLFLLFIYSILSKKILKKYEKYRKDATDELTIVDKEIANSNLLDSMGLTTSTDRARISVAKKTIVSEKSFNDSKIFLNSLMQIITLSYSSVNFPVEGVLPLIFVRVMQNLLPLTQVFSDLIEALECYREHNRYKVSFQRINNLLLSEEREENLQAASIATEKVDRIDFVNVEFSYYGNQQKVLSDYNRSFSANVINELSGKNGGGKSTIVYLLLGMLIPSRGVVLIKFASGKTLDLHKDVNLREWREKIVSYSSHENLIENGSTGQKQFENVLHSLEVKKNCQIFVLDESCNALDSDKQKFINEKLNKLLEDKKIVIFIQHEMLKI